jgi:gliding motility-associated-like protein
LLKLFNNEADYFREITENSFTGISNGSVSWGDYDNDGDLDILALGSTNDFAARIYKNQECGFEPIELDSKIIAGGDAAWGDYDSDGDLDILVSAACDCDPGAVVASPMTKIYQNVNGVFTDLNMDLVQLDGGSLAWADFDNDGDLDFIISGLSWPDIVHEPADVEYRAIVYRNGLRNEAFRRNTPATPPQNLQTATLGNAVTLSWDSSSDSETASVALTYNIFIEDLERNKFAVSPNSNLETGFRKIVSHGNAGYNKYFRLENLPKGQYAWSVQAVDNGFLASRFAQRQQFSISADAMVPNVITPNGDGINEKFVIGNTRFDWSLEVINRWGQTVHHADNYQNDWDGNGLSPGVYFCTLRNTCGEIQYKGTLSILRWEGSTQQHILVEHK